MAVLNFPDPAGQDPVDTYSPTSTPHQTSNGVTYVWTDGSWSIASTSNGELLTKEKADSYYVEQTGDNMTGDLTLGTDKITLDATDGHANFASDAIVIGDLPDGTFANVHIKPNGEVISSANNANFYAAAQVIENGAKIRLTDGANGATNKYHLYADSANGGVVTISTDGSATFAGDVNIGDWSGSTAGVVSGPSGYVHVRKNGGTNAIGIWNGAGASPTAAINPDGSATFAAGKAVISADGTTTLLPSGSITDDSRYTVLSGEGTGAGGVTGVMAGSYNSGSQWLWNVKKDGSATFSGSMGIGRSSSPSANLSTLATAAKPIGLAAYKEDGSGTNGKGLQIAYGTTVNASIDWDGSADFAGTIKVSGGFDITSDTNSGIEARSSGEFIVQREASASTSAIFDGRLGKVQTVNFKANGDYFFAGTGSFRNAVFNLEPDNDAYYTATTDAEGNQTLVYNGPTLDVKAVIQELQQRVADRDAVIADFTTRLAALEADHATLMGNNGGSY